MADIIHRVGTKEPPAKIYSALTTLAGLSGWWTNQVTGDPSLGGTLAFTFLSPQGQEIGRMEMKVTKLDPNQEVRWSMLAGPADWIGTEIAFRLTSEKDFTILNFAHRNWKEATESTAHCSTKWAVFL